MSMRFRVPPVAAEPDPSVETRPVYVEEWIEARPYANPDALLRDLHDSVHRLSRSPMKPALRIALLDLHVTPYAFLLELGDKRPPGGGIAAFEKHRLQLDGLRALALEFAGGYKRAIADSMGRASRFGRDREASTALQRALLFLASAAVHCYEQYLPVTPGTWSEMHALHRHAGAMTPAPAPPFGKGVREDFSLPVDTLYKRMLLLSLVDPYHLARGEVTRVQKLLTRHAEQAVITALHPVERAVGMFIVEAAVDRRPGHYATRAGKASADARLLDATPVITALKGRLEEVRVTGADPAGAALMGRVLRNLGLPPRRHTPRRSATGHVNVAGGLSALHHFLGGQELASRLAMRSTLPEAGAEDGPHGGIITDESIPPAYNYSAELWDLVDRGPGGIGILKRPRPNTAVGVGDLMGVQFSEEDGEPGWAVGVVRWLSVHGNAGYHAGVQLLNRSVEALALRQTGVWPSLVVPGLALPSFGADTGCSVLAPAGTYERGRELLVAARGGVGRIRAVGLVEASAAYERFSYSILDAPD